MGLEADFKDSLTLAWGVEPSQCDGLGSGKKNPTAHRTAAWGGLVGVPLGRAGRAPGTHVLLILRIERVHHILRGLGIVAALLETLHRVRLGLLHRHFSRLGWTVDAGAARVSPALSGAIGRGNARVSGLGLGAGLVHQLQTVGDCVGSGCGGCAGVRSSLGPCEGRQKRTRVRATPGRPGARYARVARPRDQIRRPGTSAP